MTSTTNTYLRFQADTLTNNKFLTIPLLNGKPTVKYDKRRTILATVEERDKWFSNGNANGIAIAINNTEFAIDTDGECEELFTKDVLSQLPSDLQNKIQSTMYTKTPHGYHRTFKIKPEDFPEGIKEKVFVKIKDHNEIVAVGREHILRERGPDHTIINDVESIVTLDKGEVNKLFSITETVGKEFKAITRVATLLFPYYYQPNRNEIIFSLSGYLHKGKTPEYIARRIALYLLSLTNYHDDDKHKIIDTIHRTYEKDPVSAEVSGYQRFKDTLISAAKPETSLDDIPNTVVEIESVLRDAGLFKIPSKQNDASRRRHSSDGNGSKETQTKAKTYEVYKYSQGIPLAEEIVLDKRNVFLQIIDGEPVINTEFDFSQKRGVIIKPHETTNQLTPIVLAYEFSDLDEINYFIKIAKEKSIYDLYLMSESLWRQLIVARDESTIIYLAADTIYSYFQDSQPTTHYTMIIGTPGAGKGAILVSFRTQGYRPVISSGMSGANILELLGSSEPCQITIMEDELSDMENDIFKETIYKTGYDITGHVPRTLDGNTSSRHNEWYLTYCHKVFAAEQPPDSKTLKGFMDRNFTIDSVKGKPKYLPKTILQQLEKLEDQRNPKYKKIISKISYLRKLCIIYRLLHHDDIIEEAELNIDGRAWELTSPQVYLFNSNNFYSKDKKQDMENRQLVLYDKILPALSKFLKKKGALTQKTLEGIIYDALTKELFPNVDSKEGSTIDCKPKVKYLIPYDDITSKVKKMVDGEDDVYRKQTFESPDYGSITHHQILDLCKNRFGGYKTKNNGVRIVEFIKSEVEKLGSMFTDVTDIEILESEQKDIDEDSEKESTVWLEWENRSKENTTTTNDTESE